MLEITTAKQCQQMSLVLGNRMLRGPDTRTDLSLLLCNIMVPVLANARGKRRKEVNSVQELGLVSDGLADDAPTPNPCILL
jgi:hypothetical protein